MASNLITKHNELIESSYRLTLTEARIVFYGLSLVNPTAKNFNYSFKIDIKEFAKMFNIEASKDIYNMLKTVVMDKFWQREFTFPTVGDRKLRVSWLSGIEYGDKEGYLKLFLNPQLEPFLHHLHNNFTSYHLEQIANFKSIYSVRLYEMAIMRLKKNPMSKVNFKILVSEIKDMLDIDVKYTRFCNFKARVLEPAKKEINKHSDIKFSYEVVKQGRTPHLIKFSVSFRQQQEEQLDLLTPPTQQYKLMPPILEKAKEMARKKGERWDIYAIEHEFYAYIEQKSEPIRNLNGAFIGFVKNKLKMM